MTYFSSSVWQLVVGHGPFQFSQPETISFLMNKSHEKIENPHEKNQIIGACKISKSN